MAEWRHTQQRRVILEEMRGLRTHPTADELHLRVRERLPRISLATVYRNLDRLVAEGQIARLECAGASRRFDGDVTPHSHVRCQRCQRVADLPVSPDMSLVAAQASTDYLLTGARVEYLGRCPLCAGADENGESGSEC
jgi:Fur family transcriptional regulator, ferric uptake regulator